MSKKFCGIALAIAIFVLPCLAQERISRVNFVDASLADAIKALARQAGLNLVVGGNLENLGAKRITVNLNDIPYMDAIDLILRANGFTSERKDNVIIVSTLPQDLPSSAFIHSFDAINLKFLGASKVIAVLSKVMPELTAIQGERSNLIIIKGKASEINKARELIASIDKPLPQILIESKVVEVSKSGMEELGIVWGSRQGQFRFSIDKEKGKWSLSEDLPVTLNTLIGRGEANVIANPRISTVDDHEAVINIGNRIPYAIPASVSGTTTQWTIQYIDAGVSLRITPRLGEDGSITTSIRPEVSSISEWRTTSAGEFPVISTRNADATVRVKDGETIVIGGLISEQDRENLSKVAILGDIPLFGYLFQNKIKEKAKTEIIFLITPRII